MDMQPTFFSPVQCVRCGAFFQPIALEIPCPHCGLPARFSLPWQPSFIPELDPPAPLSATPLSSADRPGASDASASASRIPVLPSVERESAFSGEELQSLLRLRERYQVGDAQVRDDEFTDEERARLEFMRWLYRSGRVVA